MKLSQRRLATVVALLLATGLLPARGAPGEGLDTTGESWMRISEADREFWTFGFQMGRMSGVHPVALNITKKGRMKWPGPAEMKKLRDEIACAPIRANVIAATMTKLYEDPSNSYVGQDDAFDIACGIIRGKEVSQQIREARRAGLEAHQEAEKEERK